MDSAQRHVIYGYYEPHESLAVGDEASLSAIAADIATLQSCSTVADIRRELPNLATARWLVDEERLDDLEDDDDWNWEEIGMVVDGDWPPMPTGAILDLFSDGDPIWTDLREKVGASRVSTVLNGPYVEIELDKEQELIAVLAAHGIAATRDDGLILSASLFA